MKNVGFVPCDANVTIHEQTSHEDPMTRWYHIIAVGERGDKTGTFMYGEEIEVLARWWEKEKKRKSRSEE